MSQVKRLFDRPILWARGRYGDDRVLRWFGYAGQVFGFLVGAAPIGGMLVAAALESSGLWWMAFAWFWHQMAVARFIRWQRDTIEKHEAREAAQRQWAADFLRGWER
jgi:hypothetical protein